MPLENIALFASASIVGGAILQWPIGRLSDRFDRRQVLTGVAIVGAICAAGAATIGADNPTMQMIAVTIVGGLSIPIYSLSVAHTNDHLKPSQMVAASSGLLLANGIGGMAGPAAAGAAMQVLGPSGYFWFPAAVMATLSTFALFRMTRRASVPGEKQGRYVQVPRMSVLSARLAIRNQMDRDLASMSRR
jgi:MFS family permease